MVAGFLIVAINPYSGTFAVIGTTVQGFGNGAIFVCGFALSAQVVDYSDWKFNVCSEGLVNSCVSIGQKSIHICMVWRYSCSIIACCKYLLKY